MELGNSDKPLQDFHVCKVWKYPGFKQTIQHSQKWKTSLKSMDYWNVGDLGCRGFQMTSLGTHLASFFGTGVLIWNYK